MNYFDDHFCMFSLKEEVVSRDIVQKVTSRVEAISLVTSYQVIISFTVVDCTCLLDVCLEITAEPLFHMKQVWYVKYKIYDSNKVQ